MRKIVLLCAAGMSTSLLASKMQKTADANKLPIEVKAFSDSQMGDIVNEFNPEVILLGPQVKHLYEKVSERYGQDHLVAVIDSTDYGNMDGESTSSVDGTQIPTQNNESNFGSGFGFQYGSEEDTIEVYMNEKWIVFEYREGADE